MILKGQKRKLEPEDGEASDRSSPTWESQRQFVFSVSLNKYQRGQELPEPSLRRSVLIANTLRQIALEKHGESPRDSALMSGEPATPPTNRGPSEDEDWGSAESDFSLSAAISSILTALDSTIDGGPQAALRTPLRSLENLPESAGDVAKPGYVNDVNMEDLFQEVDASLLGRVGYPAEEELVCYLPPFSSASSNFKCLPSFSSFSPLSSSSSPDSASFSGPNQSREAFELEHLMEILVES
ncbi:SERTA domain-containing protein 3-like [Xiphophorus hellerii]|uniref:SERTA domain-containing protein 3-like n=1 Tax=Xiphophorus hellerii TaxID=8084 RepID=UPI0013B44751|nr:SERTA domain-containing protein 3-like [Xiphophorus hellerii]XP_032400870.1 SERTA domain-containing protein 3-like [Xiphophorus hellerii]XP_032400871.1 SERTA domain-containing protein 3-like [Xiphophorus hellerii]XP_032400872.1 SERTA domain-containing protein 3-like [Xiphophorus hellerii]XP_032400873.1 SERTA domain-containing protein 3-like [Xiphophorus hellerii]XP_032400874.1 SERTA domain-containing protein 3-like [Xiphophorus hellerii]